MRRWKAARTGQWLLAIGVSLAVNGALLLMLAWSPWTGPRLPPPVVEITILRAPQRLPRPPEPEPPEQPPPTTVTAREVSGPISGPMLPIPSSPTPARPGPAVAAQPQAQAARPLNLGCLGRDPSAMSPEDRRRCQQQTAQRYPAPGFGERAGQEIAPADFAANRRLPDNVNIRQGIQGNPLGLPSMPGVGVVYGYDKDNKYFLPGRKTDRRVFQRAEIHNVPEPTN